MKYFKKIIGDKCYLSPINLEDAEQYTEWLNDLEVSKNLVVSSQSIGLDKEKMILEDMIKRGNQIFAIIDIKTDKLIGNCSLFTIEHEHRKAEFGIFIGDKSYWGKGFGTEATELILDYGFNILNLHNILLKVYNFNKKAIHCYEKAGFHYIGKRRESIIIGGRKYDEIYMDILSNEFKSIYVKKVMERDT